MKLNYISINFYTLYNTLIYTKYKLQITCTFYYFPISPTNNKCFI